jgi:predicted nucleic acid-binding protein
MIAADSSSLLAYFAGDTASDVKRVVEALTAGELALPPVVVTELLSGRPTALPVEALIKNIQNLDIMPGYWERAGRARRLLHQHGLKAKVADALIAQSCIDHDVALIARDKDFRYFAKYCGLKLA